MILDYQLIVDYDAFAEELLLDEWKDLFGGVNDEDILFQRHVSQHTLDHQQRIKSHVNQLVEQDPTSALTFNVRAEHDHLLRQLLSKSCIDPSVLWAEALRLLRLFEDQILNLLACGMQENIQFSTNDIFGNMDTQRALITIDFGRLCDIIDDAIICEDLIWSR
jgi:hypothetical protein